MEEFAGDLRILYDVTITRKAERSTFIKVQLLDNFNFHLYWSLKVRLNMDVWPCIIIPRKFDILKKSIICMTFLNMEFHQKIITSIRSMNWVILYHSSAAYNFRGSSNTVRCVWKLQFFRSRFSLVAYNYKHTHHFLTKPLQIRWMSSSKYLPSIKIMLRINYISYIILVQRRTRIRVTCSWKGQLERSLSWKVLSWKEVSN